MKIIALSGPPGAGKTTFKNTNPQLKPMPFFDVADVYAEYLGIKPADAFSELLNRIVKFISDTGCEVDLVAEAVFAEGSYQRTWLSYIAEANNCEIEYIEFNTPLDVCKQRIEAEWANLNQNDLIVRTRYNARKRIIDAYQQDAQRSN
jgi:predicted kinase